MREMFSGSKFIFLTFSDFTLKAASLDLSTEKPRVIYFAQHVLPPGLVFDDKIVDLPRFKEEVRNFLQSNKEGFQTNKIVFGINEQETFFAVFEGYGLSKEALSSFLKPILPYDPIEASVRFVPRSGGRGQVVATKSSLLADINSIFENTGFELSKVETLPLACLGLRKEGEPFIFVVVEDQTMQLALVIEGILVFTSSFKFGTTLESSKEKIIQLIKRVSTSEYDKYQKQQSSLHRVFIVGPQAEAIRDFLSGAGLSVEVVNVLERFSFNSSSDLSDYTKCLLLSLGIENSLIFTKNPLETVEGKKGKIPSFQFKKRWFLAFGFLVLAIFLVTFSFSRLKHPQNPKNSRAGTATSSSQKPVSAKNQLATPSATKIAEINKKDYTIKVLNGTDISKLASKERDFLVSKGYYVVAVGNADRTDYQLTTLQYKLSAKAIIPDLTSTLQARYSITTGSSLSESAAQDIIIILGRR